MKREKKVKFLRGLLSIIGGCVILILISSIIFNIQNIRHKGVKDALLSIIISIIFFASYFIIVHSLIKILNLILSKNPFVHESNKYFGKIGYSIFIVGIIDALVHYPDQDTTGFVLIGTNKGSLKPIFFLYMVIGILAFILGDVFKMAIEIKDENDLTI